ncbi:hypothetical protein [Pedobacter sp. R20-19]|uniref:hypothetical protein n=1 Tax=Pedobacter sp. R20-19 TaxID=1270196 RepID=UPI0012FADC58|nr:hypothetical protein [Pedobacter sp. R20-19]
MKKYIYFNKGFNFQLLRHYLALRATTNWNEHFNCNDCEVSWKGISICSATGGEVETLKIFSDLEKMDGPNPGNCSSL